MNPLVLLAKSAVENFIEQGKEISLPDNLPREFLDRKAGVFVTIEKKGQLRGCVGTYLPTKENVAKETIQNAISAAVYDNRFEPVKKGELAELSYTVYILSEPEAVKNYSELDPEKFGVMVKSRGFSSPDAIFSPAPKPYQKTGILLPDLEGIDSAEKQISIACQKGGINPAIEDIEIYKFGVEKLK